MPISYSDFRNKIRIWILILCVGLKTFGIYKERVLMPQLFPARDTSSRNSISPFFIKQYTSVYRCAFLRKHLRGLERKYFLKPRITSLPWKSTVCSKPRNQSFEWSIQTRTKSDSSNWFHEVESGRHSWHSPSEIRNQQMLANILSANGATQMQFGVKVFHDSLSAFRKRNNKSRCSFSRTGEMLKAENRKQKLVE